jgi:RNA polymerase sigma-70 factor (ECF subfamily)
MEAASSAAHMELADRIEQLFEEYYEGFYRYLVLSGCSPADADEFIQEAFLRLFAYLKEGGRVENHRNWLVRVVNNLRADEGRRIQRAAGREGLVAEDRTGHEPDPERRLIEEERFQALQKAMTGLTDRQYQYLLLRGEGLKLREIAEIFGVGPQAVADAIGRAMDRIGRIMHG